MATLVPTLLRGSGKTKASAVAVGDQRGAHVAVAAGRAEAKAAGAAVIAVAAIGAADHARFYSPLRVTRQFASLVKLSFARVKIRGFIHSLNN